MFGSFVFYHFLHRDTQLEEIYGRKSSIEEATRAQSLRGLEEK